MVPREIQRRVWATYVRGQEVRKDPTREYLDAADAAIDAVDQRERARVASAAEGDLFTPRKGIEHG